jgi:hypothetical protein
MASSVAMADRAIKHRVAGEDIRHACVFGCSWSRMLIQARFRSSAPIVRVGCPTW